MEDNHDMHMEERLWYGDYYEPEDLSDDGQALASAGMGTDEDYGGGQGEDDWLDEGEYIDSVPFQGDSEDL